MCKHVCTHCTFTLYINVYRSLCVVLLQCSEVKVTFVGKKCFFSHLVLFAGLNMQDPIIYKYYGNCPNLELI